MKRTFLIILLAITAISYFMNSNEEKSYDQASSAAIISDDLEKITTEFSRIDQGHDPQYINTTILLYQIYHEDSLMLWNDNHLPDQVIKQQRFIPVSQDTFLHAHALTYIDTAVERDGYRGNLHVDKLEGEIYIKVHKNKNVTLWKILLIISFTLAILLLYNEIIHGTKTGSNFIMISLILYLSSMMGVNLFQLDHVLHFPMLGNWSIMHWLMSIVFLYIWCYGYEKYKIKLRKNKLHTLSGGIIIASVFIGFTMLIKSYLLHTSLFSLSSHSIQYSYTGVSFLLFAISTVLGLFYLSSVLLKSIKLNLNSDLNYYLTLIGGITIPYLLAFLISDFPAVPMLIFTIIYVLILDLHIEARKKKIIFIFWWMLLLSAFLAGIIQKYTIVKNIHDREEYAQQLYRTPQDRIINKLAELDNHIADSDIFLPLSEMPSPIQLDRQDYIQYVREQIQKWMNDDELIINVNGYEPSGKSIFSIDPLPLSDYQKQQRTILEVSQRLSFNSYTGEYILPFKIENNYFNQPLKLYLSFSTDTVKEKEQQGFGYIIIQDGKIVKSSLKDDDVLPVRELYEIRNTHLSGDYSYVVTRPAENIRIVSYKSIGGLVRAISLFSLILTMMAVLLLSGMLLYRLIPYLPRVLIPELDSSDSLRYKIQMTIISLIVLSFIIIGIVTSYYFGNVLEQNNSIQNQKLTISVLNNIKSLTEGARNNTESRFIIENRLKEISRNHGVDLDVYDHNGRYLMGSEPEVAMSRLPYKTVTKLNDEQSVPLRTSASQYSLLPLYNTSSVPYAHLSIKQSPQLTTNSRIIDFLSTILNVYVFLFLTASALSIAISNSITKPLQILAHKLREFKLGRTTETLEWNSKDEIGALINDYNNLTKKLQESAHIIAKTERDMAWREMAKQVAHEIKNPLTPMKLSIQYLQSKIHSDPENAQALIERISVTLIEQINNLSQIADEFSNFAKMPKAKNEKVALNEIVESIHDLFRKREDIDIHLSVPIDGIFVYADRNHVVRILNNIVKNAIQAIPTERRGKINISLYKKDNDAIIKVKDNGTGIPEDMKSKVFEPNFTTKSSGTGLGLAISANMLESCNGKLYFETVEGKGTAFFIEIPMMRLEDNFARDNRVMLD